MKNKIFTDSVRFKLRQILAKMYYLTGFYKRIHKGKVIILMYHRVVKDDDPGINYIQPGMYVTESSFELQMQFIHREYEVISFNDLLVASNKNGLHKNKNYCVVTFDDGWLDNYQNAFPVLKKYNIPATIFLVTSFVGKRDWFWPDKLGLIFQYCNKHYLLAELLKFTPNKRVEVDLLKQFVAILKEHINLDDATLIDKLIEAIKPHGVEPINELLEFISNLFPEKIKLERITLNWDEIDEMSKQGISFGSHTCNHKLLTMVPIAEVERELIDSMAILKKKVTKYTPVFCYPNGYYNEVIKEMVEKAGYTAAVTTKYGIEDRSLHDRYTLKRIGLHNDISRTLSMFVFHISGIGHRRTAPY